MKKLVYLACPYSHPEPDVRQERFDVATKVAGHLMQMGLVVFSPLTHGHPIAQVVDLPTDWKYWKDFCAAYLETSYRMIVLKLPGWDTSVGVQAEIELASALGIPIELWDVTTDEFKFTIGASPCPA